MFQFMTAPLISSMAVTHSLAVACNVELKKVAAYNAANIWSYTLTINHDDS